MTTLNLTKIKPQAPVNVSASPVVGGIVVSWQQNALINDTYNVYRSDTVADFSTASQIAVGVKGTTLTDNVVPTDVDGPWYWVSAVNPAGVESDASPRPYLLGSRFKSLQIGIGVYALAAATAEVDGLEVRVYYTPVVGAPTNTGWVTFTTPVTQGSPFTVTPWTNPDNARTIDSSIYATISLAADSPSQTLIYNTSDITGLPDTATVTGVEFRMRGRNSSVANVFTSVLMFTPGFGANPLALGFPAFSTNNTYQTVTTGGAGQVDNLGVDGVATSALLVPTGAVDSQQIKSSVAQNILNAFGYGVAKRTSGSSFSTTLSSVKSVGDLFSSIGGSTAITPASEEPGTAWDTWYNVASSNGISTSPAPSVIFANAFLSLNWTGLAISTGTVAVEIRLCLYNRTTNAVLSSETFKVLEWSGSGLAVVRQQTLVQMNWLFQQGLNATIPANDTLDVRWQMRKTRTDAASTLTMQYNHSFIETTVE